jgi:hypothetical protein
MEPEGSLLHCSQGPATGPFLSKKCLNPKIFVPFRNKLFFYGEDLLAPRSTPKLEDYPLSAVLDCLFNIFAATPIFAGRLLHPQPEDAPYRDDRDPNNMETVGTRLLFMPLFWGPRFSASASWRTLTNWHSAGLPTSPWAGTVMLTTRSWCGVMDQKKMNGSLNHLSSIHPNIQFSMRTESNGHLPLPDIDIYRRPGGSLGHTVNRKPTHTDLCLNAKSHHHPAKNSLLSTLAHRATTVCDEESLTEESEFLRSTFK